MTSRTTYFPCGCEALVDDTEVLTATLCATCMGLYRASRGRGSQLEFLGTTEPEVESL